MTIRYFLSSIFLFVFLLTGCGPSPAGTSAPAPVSPTPQAVPTAPPTPSPTPTPDPIQIRLDSMTLEQKAAQLLVAGIEGHTAGEDARSAVQDKQVGGVILFGRNVESGAQLAALTNGLKALNGDDIPLLLAVDEEGGRVSRMPPEVSDLPAPLTVGRTGDPALCRAFGELLGAECAAFGLNTDFAPALDIWSNPENTVIGDRAFGSDWETVSTLGSAAWQGLAGQGVLPVVKHFPGHGDTAVDSHVGLPVVEKDLRALEALELLPFRRAVEEGVPAVMVSHILERALDPWHPASLSPRVVRGLLREELGFEGVVFTDDLTMAAVSDTYGMGEAAVLALEAGCDMLLVCHGADNLAAAHAGILSAVESGRLPEERLDESVRRVLTLKTEQGFTNDPVPPPDTAALNARIAAFLDQLLG